MKYIKSYEEVNIDQPEVGDYVICKENNEDRSDDKAAAFTLNNIGKIIKISPVNTYKYDISYTNVPINLSGFFHDVYGEKCRPIQDGEIIYWSKDKDELMIHLSANKYNL